MDNMDNKEVVLETQETVAEQLGNNECKNQKKNSKKTARKEARRAKKQYKKKLRREIRDRRTAVFRSRGFLGKILYIFGRIINLLVMLAVAITVVRVNYKDAGVFALNLIMRAGGSSVNQEVDEETLATILGTDEEAAAMIDASAPIGEDETWAIYMYIVGSNLEARSNDQMSEAALTLAGLEGAPLADARKAVKNEQLSEMINTMFSQGLDLPNSFYAKNEVPRVVSQALNAVNVIGGPSINPYAASEDIYTMFAVDLPENVKIVFQPGGAGAWNHDMINPNRCQRFVYDSEGVTEVYNGHIRNMGTAESLSDFLTFCEEEYPADHTMLVFWNHGGGPFGYGVDYLYNGDMLTLNEMHEALSTVYKPNENKPPLDVIGFDACLMASMEAAYEFNGFASYLVGSEDVEPGEGWDYTAWLSALAENPRMNALQMSKAVTDSYVEYYARANAAKNGSDHVFSTIDLKYADDLYEAYGAFAAAALKESVHSPGTAAVIGKSANSSIKYAGGDDAYNLVDLRLFMEAAAPFYEKEATAVMNLVDKVVVYNRANNLAKESTGITVYYPSTVKSPSALSMAIDYINNICHSDDVRALYYYKVAGCLNEELQTYVSDNYGQLLPMDSAPIKNLLKQELSFRDDGNYSFATSENALTLMQDVELNIMQLDGKGNAIYLGEDQYIDINADNSISTCFESKWGFLEGQPLFLKYVSSTESFIRYSSSVRHNDSAASLVIVYDLENEQWQLVGVQPESASTDSFMADRITTNLGYGDRITPVYVSYDMETGSSSVEEGETVIFRESSSIVDGVLPNGQYISYVSITDARGEVYTMPAVSFNINNGAMTDAQTMELSWMKAA